MLEKWPHFTYDKEALGELEFQFSQNTGTAFGVLKHIAQDSKDDLLVEILSTEALKTSEIEGEILNRESVQSSIKKNLGLITDKRKIPPAEYGISEMMVDLYLNYNKTLSHDQLFEWHEMITNGRRDLTNIGCYRTHEDPMQVVSGKLDQPKVHFEAPPSKQVTEEMEQFINWFNTVHSAESKFEILPLVKAGIAHLYFVSIHPFEDGNGRIHRFLIHNVLSLQGVVPRGLMFPVSAAMLKNPADYDASLEAFSRPLLSLIDYHLDEMGQLTVENDTASWYRYMDMTAQAEALYSFVTKTIEEELVEELSFLANYDKTKKAIQDIIDMPDRLIDLFIQLCLQNNGSLSARKRTSHFDFLTDEELAAMEQAVKDGYSALKLIK